MLRIISSGYFLDCTTTIFPFFFFFLGHASCSSLCRCVEQQRMAVTCAGRHGACPNGKWARAHSQKREMKDFESLESSFRSIVVE